MAEKKLSKKALNKSISKLVLWTFDMFLSRTYADIRLFVCNASFSRRIV